MSKIIKNDDTELVQMIEKLKHTPVTEINIDIQDQVNIYNWLKELELYRHLCGPLNKV